LAARSEKVAGQSWYRDHDETFSSGPLQSLGTSALLQEDYPTALKFYQSAVEVNEKTYGEGSDKVAESLVVLTRVYIMQKQYDKAEPVLLRAVKKMSLCTEWAVPTS